MLLDEKIQMFPYYRADYEEVPCNLCKRRDVIRLGKRDRNGLRVRTVICKNCGFIFISPRMTAEWYARYYDGEYRRQIASYYGNPILFRPDDMYESQLKHGRWIARYLRERGIEKLNSILEIGSSTGGLLKALADEFRADVTGVEPSTEEADFASRMGVCTLKALFEHCSFEAEERFDLIVSSQSYNHLLDPRLVTEKVRGLLQPQGVFFLECMDFFSLCEFQKAFFNAVQIDHVSMFVPLTLQSMCEVAGLEVVPGSLLCDRFQPVEVSKKQRAAGLPFIHARLLARPGQPKEPPAAYQTIRKELDSLHLHPMQTFLNLKVRPFKSTLPWRMARYASSVIRGKR